MNWIEIKARFENPPEDWSPVISLLAGYGCENTLQEDQPPRITACLVEVAGSDDRATEISKALVEVGAAEIESRVVPDEDWAEYWKQFFKPRRVGKHFMVVPGWESVPVERGIRAIEIDPGQAFGTGDHPTTRMCLELMEETPLDCMRFADVGCGSGILSIAACLCGAVDVSGVDIEELSVEIARENALRNRVNANFAVGNSIDVLGEGPWDVVASNIISSTLIQMAPSIAKALSPGGHWIVSGILEANWADVLSEAEKRGFELVQARSEEGWVGAILRI